MTDPVDPTRFCDLARNEEATCETEAVVAIKDREGTEVWGCELHARFALEGIEGSCLSRVHDPDAARRLLSLPWNHRGDMGL